MELKKGETIMIDAALHLPASFLNETFSDRSGVPLDLFELYYRGKRLEGEAALASWGVGKGSTIEVKMRGRGGMPSRPNSRNSSPRGGDAGARATSPLATAAPAAAASSTGIFQKGISNLAGYFAGSDAEASPQARVRAPCTACPEGPKHRTLCRLFTPHIRALHTLCGLSSATPCMPRLLPGRLSGCIRRRQRWRR